MAKILVVDDDRDILRLLQFALGRAGHTVITSYEGSQGLELAQSERPDLIIADVMMPEMTGYDFCRQVRTNPALKKIPIIVFSARFQPVDKKTALEAGATDYLPKTHSPDVLLKRIAELLSAPDATITPTHAAVGLFSLRGGVGVTSLAVNLAVALAQIRQKPLALVDLALMGGHAALMLGLRPAGSVADVLSSPNSPSLESLKPHLIRHNSGVFLLPSALTYNKRLLLNDNGLVEDLITVLKFGFPTTILDIPPAFQSGYLPAFRLFDKILLILSADMPSLQSTALALQELARLGVEGSKIGLILNHVTPQGDLPVDMIQKAIKRPILLNIPYEADMIKSVNSGKPLVLTYPQSAGARTITRLANTLT